MIFCVLTQTMYGQKTLQHEYKALRLNTNTAKKRSKKNVLKVFSDSVVSKTWSRQELDRNRARDKNKLNLEKNNKKKVCD